MTASLPQRMDRLDRAYRLRDAVRQLSSAELSQQAEDEVALAERLLAMSAPCNGGEAAKLLHFCAGRLHDPLLQGLLVRAAHRLSTDPEL